MIEMTSLMLQFGKLVIAKKCLGDNAHFFGNFKLSL